VLVSPATDCHRARREMEATLHERFALDHTTLQVDHEGGELLDIERTVATPTRAD
jgi:cobalt-zinc-cadmium efflux system protein